MKEEIHHERAFFLECFDGLYNYFDQARISREGPELEHTILSNLGGIQPDKLRKIIRACAAGDGNDGLMERFQLMVYPNLNLQQSDVAPNTAALAEVKALLTRLALLPEPKEEPPEYSFDDAAQLVFNKAYGEVLEETKSADAKWQAVLGKTPALIARLALIDHVVDERPGRLIGELSLTRALALVTYFQSHTRRVLALDTDPYKPARALLQKLPKLSALESFTVNDIATKHWGHLMTPHDRQFALDALCDHYYLVKVETPTGGRSIKEYYINPGWSAENG